jgi:hypothetical protein
MEPLQIKSADTQAKGRRGATCRRVLEHLHLQLSELDLLCFIDEEIVDDIDFEGRKNAILGVANRGVFVHDVNLALATGAPPLPSYVKTCLRSTNGENLFQKLIFVHGSACEPEESLIITFSHELQHYLQRRNEPQASAADMRLRGLLQNWQEHPSEHEAMLVSKQVATALCGEDLVSQYAESRIELSKKNQQSWHGDLLRWEFFRDLSISSNYEFASEVAKLVEKHRATTAF